MPGFVLASRVGHLRFTFTETQAPYVLIEASRASVMGSADTSNLTFPLGSVEIDEQARQLTGHNAERQDFIIGPNPAPGFAGFFCVRFSEPFVSWGVVSNADGELSKGLKRASGKQLSGYVTFDERIAVLDVRVGVSFISTQQACSNVDAEIPDGTSLEETAQKTRAEWAEKLDRIQVEGASPEDKTMFYTAVFHTLQVGGLFS